jgi:ribonuclease D
MIISSQQELEDVCKAISFANEIAIDTEFFNQTDCSYFHKLSTIQIAWHDECGSLKLLLIDVISKKITNYSSLKKILINPKILKIIHSAKNDLGVIYGFFGVKIVNIFDTQIAFCMYNNLKTIPSYGFLVNMFFGIAIEKSQQNAKWHQRPLTQEMVNYAINDVVYLIDLKNILMEKLIQSGNYGYFESEMLLISSGFNEKKFSIYKKNKTDSELSNLEKSRLAKLLEYRQNIASELNLKSDILASNNEIVEISGMPYSVLKKNKSNISVFDSYIEATEKHEWCQINPVFNVSNIPKDLIKKNQKYLSFTLNDIAKKSKISRFLVISTDDLNALSIMISANYDPRKELSRYFTGWRNDIFGYKVINYIDYLSQRSDKDQKIELLPD